MKASYPQKIYGVPRIVPFAEMIIPPFLMGLSDDRSAAQGWLCCSGGRSRLKPQAKAPEQ